MTEAEILKKAIKTYGKDNQVDMAIEEMSELTKALLKERRYAKEHKHSGVPILLTSNIIEEIADVAIMLEQLKMIYHCETQVIAVAASKVLRLKDRMEDIL